MKTISIPQNISRYAIRQAKDIAKYGKKEVVRTVDVKEEILEVFTPFRRLSKKPCILSDSQYFIDKFEKTTQMELPKQDNWLDLSVEEKIDYIVKGRYRRFLANKIMNAIKNQPVEHNFMLSENGEILAHNIGDAKCVNIENAIKLSDELYDKRIEFEKKGGKFLHIESEVATTTVHNHPAVYSDITSNMDNDTKDFFKEFFGIEPEAEFNPMSIEDIIGDVNQIRDAFVVDARGHKFYFTPNPFNIKTKEDYDVFKLTLSKFMHMAKGAEKRYRKIYDKEKAAMEKLIASGNNKEETLIEKRFSLLKAYADILSEQLTDKEYRKFLMSDFVKENIGYFKELN